MYREQMTDKEERDLIMVVRPLKRYAQTVWCLEKQKVLTIWSPKPTEIIPESKHCQTLF